MEENYEIRHSNEDFMAKFSHSENTITYGAKFRDLPPIAQSFVTYHEIAHSKGKISEIEADSYALLKIIKKGYSPESVKSMLLKLNLRTKEQLELL